MWVEEPSLTLMILGHHNGEMAGQMETLAAIMPTSSTVSLFSDSLGKDSCSQYIDEKKKAQKCQWSGQRQLMTNSDSPSLLSSSLWLTPPPCPPPVKAEEIPFGLSDLPSLPLSYLFCILDWLLQQNGYQADVEIASKWRSHVCTSLVRHQSIFHSLVMMLGL